ncbi:uncharacterized protein A4U43_C09F3970 [Asparagus officinalis]|uniref:protein-serine/threonine phosphatase n=1 Tax=Asparagus officinalis TaxID=4686 RepID=A0A5P1E9Z0_ASPOF|nr:uncharacterized protein A4U43_C09F3970 [Asparagus officinalis]
MGALLEWCSSLRDPGNVSGFRTETQTAMKNTTRTKARVKRRVLQDGDPDGDEEHNKDKGKGKAIEGSSDSAKEKKKEYPSQSQCDLAAALLARLALARNSEDNISVIVVDLRKEMA